MNSSYQIGCIFSHLLNRQYLPSLSLFTQDLMKVGLGVLEDKAEVLHSTSFLNDVLQRNDVRVAEILEQRHLSQCMGGNAVSPSFRVIVKLLDCYDLPCLHMLGTGHRTIDSLADLLENQVVLTEANDLPILPTISNELQTLFCFYQFLVGEVDCRTILRHRCKHNISVTPQRLISELQCVAVLRHCCHDNLLVLSELRRQDSQCRSTLAHGVQGVGSAGKQTVAGITC
mmetsp:Transcript_58474/g.103977  ORF Transcript_58474/g.103977 Transcript_58474/m.103977 type:complete len:229 (+) Transcript_58474:606-1292(+)